MTERTTDITRDLCDSQSQALYDDDTGQPVDETKTEKKYRIDAEELNEKFRRLFSGIPVANLIPGMEILEMAEQELHGIPLTQDEYICFILYVNRVSTRQDADQPHSTAGRNQKKRSRIMKNYKALAE
ncbi:hypothetical protein [Faecalibaculum rodentium]|uniref:hypothetical protein n=1 Tax=Faecalibaculum rodentium TaxID=1702221 RepID=UPI0023F28F80|nr:hypothetical protein [Faecalibaculum rodentium]